MRTKQFRHSSTDWLFDSQLAPYVDAFKHHLAKGQYAPYTVATYVACIAHFAHWLTLCLRDIQQIDEAVIQEFLDVHLPQCNCVCPAQHVRHDLRAALGHLLIVLRAHSVIAARLKGISPMDVELRLFDEHLSHVRGLSLKTRGNYLRIIRCLLVQLFDNRNIAISLIMPDDIRQFLASQSKCYRTPSSVKMLISALRSYFRFRNACGDQVNHLIGVTSYPANWQLASLPKTLNKDEVARLLSVIGDPNQSSRRDLAIVHCALDLGLRSAEVAKLGLDDIDWQTGTLTLRRTKSRREDVMPLPEATGRAIAEYLKFERPQTTSRTVFIRRIAPRDQPIGPDLVRKAIRQAYARAGLPYTKAHILRHTMASRLLDGGSSLKEVADVLRHRSLNTTLIYAQLDSRNLRDVALPWPGCAS
jgi:site-specific recombinase XerD